MFQRVPRFFLTIMLVVSGCISTNVSGQARLAEPKPSKAVEGILAAFDRFPIVALGELHWSLNEHEFITALIEHPAFANKVNDIVVEFGNALYQPIMDRYIAGETVAGAELQQVWRNTTQTSMPWDAPIYAQFFAKVRALNQRLPKQKRLRVLLGDPPVDWDVIKTRADMNMKLFLRDEHFAEVVEREVLNKRRKALMISGNAHMRRCCLAGPLGTTARIEKSHPGTVFVALPHQGFFQDRNEELEARMSAWPKPGLALVKETWLGQLSPDLITPAGLMGTSPDGPLVPAPSPFKGMLIQDVTDAYLYLGPKASLRYDSIPPEVLRDEAYQRELQRRQEISGMRPMPPPRRP